MANTESARQQAAGQIIKIQVFKFENIKAAISPNQITLCPFAALFRRYYPGAWWQYLQHCKPASWAIPYDLDFRFLQNL